jgi:integrase
VPASSWSSASTLFSSRPARRWPFTLIASGLDVVAVSRRLGHASPTVTLNIYSHLFVKTDAAAASAIEAALRTSKER